MEHRFEETPLGSPPRPIELAGAVPRLVVDPGACWFEVAPRPRADLSRRRSLRALFAALLRERVERPGRALPMRTLVSIGWPGERTHPELAAGRVYTAIKSLRQMGLAGVLLSRDDGYLLDPAAIVDRV